MGDYNGKGTGDGEVIVRISGDEPKNLRANIYTKAMKEGMLEEIKLKDENGERMSQVIKTEDHQEKNC